MSLEAINQRLAVQSAPERIAWALSSQTGLYAMTSGGTDSALMADHLPTEVPMIFINTGFAFSETLEQVEELRQRFGLSITEVRPSPDEVEAARSLDSSSYEYRLVTRLNPLRRAIAELGIKALLVGVRSDQNTNRASFQFVAPGKFGELRIHPFLDWTNDQVQEYINSRGLPRNRKYYEGYGSVEDVDNTQPGVDREGRSTEECGLNLLDGALVRQSQTSTIL